MIEMKSIHPPTDLYAPHVTRMDLVAEAYRLIGALRAGETPSMVAYEAAAFHLLALENQFPNLDHSLMAIRLAQRLQPVFSFQGGK